MEVKIVLATPYKIGNYGAMLQAWALRRILSSMGHSVQYLNCRYMWPGVFGWRRLLCSKSIQGLKTKLQINKVMRRSIEELGGFDETQPYDSLSELLRKPPECDCLMSGSDQIFGPNYFAERKRYLPVLLGFGDSRIKRVVYGASFGTNDIGQLAVNYEIRSFFERIEHIGVREKSGLGLLRQLTGREGYWTPDPTLMLAKKDYVRAFNLNEVAQKKPYVCAYMLGWGGREHLRDEACKDMMKQYGAEEIHIIHGEISLAQWLREILNASCVVTNSFHGHCFSLIFGKPCKILGFDGDDAWRNERNDDLQRTLLTHSLAQISAAGYDYLDVCLK